MGSIFAKHILQRDKPKIGLMNVGSEEEKGHELAKDTAALFKASQLRDQFIGNVEGRDINKGVCDVIVTDGFVGNVVLKMSEGVFDFVMKMTAKELMSTLQNEKALGQKALAEHHQALRLPRDGRGAAAGHRRHLHHLPRQLRRARDQERPGDGGAVMRGRGSTS